MAEGDQNEQPPRYWFPYWSGPPPPVRPQLSRRLSPPAAPKPKDVDVVPQPEKTAVHPPAAAAAETKHGKAAAHRAHHHKEADKEKKDEHKSKDKDKKHHADAGEDSKHGKEKEKEKKHHAGDDSKHGKEKEKEKEKKHHADAGEDGKHKEKEKKHHAHSGEDGKHKEKESKAEHGKLHGEIKAGVADVVRRATGSVHGQGHPGASVITLAGENKGASMKVGGKGKDGSWKEHQGGHRLTDGGTAADGKQPEGQKKQGMMTALINSNVQVINNSLLLHSSCSGGDPGVHLKLSAKSAKKDKQKHAAGTDKSDKSDKQKHAASDDKSDKSDKSDEQKHSVFYY